MLRQWFVHVRELFAPERDQVHRQITGNYQMIKNFRILVVFGLALPLLASASNPSPYSGQQQRQIKSLSKSDIDGYLEGKGMGLAKAAELNHYPGPRHVLDLSRELGLSKEQRQKTGELFKHMKKDAVSLGEKVIAEEQKLDRMFADGTVDGESLKQQLAIIAKLQGELRYIHLRTHLAQRKILSHEQIQQYDRLRGYGDGAAHHHHHGH
jgi:hypothetical protein